MGRKIKSWAQVESGDDAIRYAQAYGAEVERQTGSHRVIGCPANGKKAIIPNNDSLPAGTKSSIKRQLIAMGISIVGIILGITYWWFQLLIDPAVAGVVAQLK